MQRCTNVRTKHRQIQKTETSKLANTKPERRNQREQREGSERPLGEKIVEGGEESGVPQ